MDDADDAKNTFIIFDGFTGMKEMVFYEFEIQKQVKCLHVLSAESSNKIFYYMTHPGNSVYPASATDLFVFSFTT